ncbi:PREDICTED: uncharacterized protein LOC108361785 isoform X1 [Rhagoletis zephyria]|uniref:uncharacterized protein LOC108361785 isoform X1 n=1 Tax=Rhagoletis zephyria TaxID=28612 RepID=UPI0008119FFA|nr:PREDICTED: uncharacterized protein LOC108361785 isoform X1 [Rhagoletis zephyria]
MQIKHKMLSNIIEKIFKPKKSNFNEEALNQIWPPRGTGLSITEFGKELLQKCTIVPKPNASEVKISDFIEQSLRFPLKFGRDTCRVMSEPKERYPEIEKQIGSAYPVIHERVLGLYLAFLEHKCKYGNDLERVIYNDMTVTGLVQRLLEKRCAAFVGPLDDYLLLKGRKTMANFFDVGTADEKAPLVLKDVLSYDEIKLSAFLSFSSHTEFLNDGRRFNCGIIEEDKSKIEIEGVIIGIIGGRFEAEDVMEWQDIMITSMQNTKERGYGFTAKAAKKVKKRSVDYRQLWTRFYEQQDLIYDKVENVVSPRFYKDPQTRSIFDNLIMEKRYSITFDTLLLEANARGAAAAKQVYLHVVGIGLGAWRVVQHQDKIFLKTFSERLQVLLPCLANISVVHFSNFRSSAAKNHISDGAVLGSETQPSGSIKTFLHDRYPAEKLPSEYENMLIVESYAGDANALPGNEFWKGWLTSSGDPAAACSTLISELHNPHINTKMVNGENLHIASDRFGVLHIAEYCKEILH